MWFLQLGNSVFTTRLWVVTQFFANVVFLSPTTCDDCGRHHIMVCRVKLAQPWYDRVK